MKIKILNYILVTGIGLQSVVFLSITITWAIQRSVSNEPTTSQVCTNCDDLLPKYDKDGMASKIEKLRTSQNSKCCGGTKDILGLAAQKETTDMFYNHVRYMVTEAVYQMCDSYEDQTPYVKAVGITGYNSIGELYQLLWNENGRTVTKPSIKDITHLQDEGEIFIRRAGLYTVASQLVIQANRTTSYDMFSHFIYVLSHKYGTRRMLGELRQSLLRRNTTLSLFRAVFKLDLHDRISVVITNPEHIVTNSDENAFSVHFSG